ncbi:MAG: photosynthetic reaction center cytochrome PufC [Gemmatimonadota bacterium]
MNRAAIIALVALSACQGGRKEAVQVGYRGTGQVLVYDKSVLEAQGAANRLPPPIAPASPNSPVVKWQNVQVLTDVSANELNRTMIAMTQWVSPKQSCVYCHNPANFGSDEKYPKVVARRMLQMTRHINSNWQAHVQGTGVTCYTCHRGNNVPPVGIWYFTDENQYLRAFLDRQDVRVQAQTVGHTNLDNTSIRQATNTYALMIHMSRSLNVTCNACHASRSWTTWQNAPPARITALYGIRMVRDLNTNYLLSIASAFPPYRLGPHGDSPKLQCSTCHEGQWKPLNGAQMVKDYPSLWGAPQWARGGPSDTGSVGFKDLRNADSIPVDGGKILGPQSGMPRTAPSPQPVPGMTTAPNGASPQK